MQNKLQAIEQSVLSGLKDFQLKTAKRVFELFKQGQSRVLVADEVGLGKTLIARGVIAQTARYRFEELPDELFKVVYVCSNQIIAKQNLSKLKVSDDTTMDGVTDTRLSMQHLRIYEQKFDAKTKANYIQLIPLTPSTSFYITDGGGSISERALIYAILKRTNLFGELFREHEARMNHIFMCTATSGWKAVRDRFEQRVQVCDTQSGGLYIRDIGNAVEKSILDSGLYEQIISLITDDAGQWAVIGTLRKLFAEISVDLLKPDLVIMDEFQRFRSLLKEDNSSETSVLAHKFLNGNDLKVLLLSATPYKLYSTLEEIYENANNDPYYEFMEVMEFLQPEKHLIFKEIWSNYSLKLRELHHERTSIIEAQKNAENAMYEGVCRTERMSAIAQGSFIDDSKAKQAINITENDILAFIEAERLVRDIAGVHSVPVDYIKSSPFLLSFSRQYKLRKHIDAHFQKHPELIKQANRKLLWVDEYAIKRYQELPPANARLEALKEIAFENKAELLLWIPPSRQYYEPQGVFGNAQNFSKILVFSAWEMVPRMIATLISYEAERKTVGLLVAANKDKKNTCYSDPNSKRFPVARLRFNIENELPQSMSMFCLLYPSQTLADIYNPIFHSNKGDSLEDIERELSSAIELKLQDLIPYQDQAGRKDERWYFLAPLLMDSLPHVENWLSKGRELVSDSFDEDEAQDKRTQKGFELHLDKLNEYFANPEAANLGVFPEDLVAVLLRMAIASPAVCSYRVNGRQSVFATQFAKTMLNLFNKTEATAVVELCYKKASEDAHWKNVLLYCRDGNLQAMLEEYIHMLVESNGLGEADDKHSKIHAMIMSSMKLHSASSAIDTYQTFRDSIRKKNLKRLSLRSHFAVGFYKGEGESTKMVNRKESIRNSFNSPFRPFVLATTSIGQEGLDFHYYCRKIMHWNLPSNPIDLEQREGRIDRFKCLAIRQNIADRYSAGKAFEKDVWTEMFDRAQKEHKPCHSELVPFWCLPDATDIKIERIVPAYPLSKDIGKYERLIKILSLYRLTLGQARQEELLEHIFTTCQNGEELKDLFINLSPYYRDQLP